MALTPILTQTQVENLKDSPKFGKVVANNDPEMLGKIKVYIPGIFEGEPESLPWIRRKNDTLFCGDEVEAFDVPDVGSVIEIKWNYDENTPMYSGAPNSKKHMSNLFRQNYPYEGGFRFGVNYIKFDKQKPEITICNGANNNVIILSPEGKTTLRCTNLTMEVQETCNLNCQTFNVKASSNTNIDTPTTHITGNVVIDKNLNVTGTTTDKIDVIANGISLVKHTHQYTAPSHPAGGADTAPPTK